MSILDLTWMNTAATNLTDNFSIHRDLHFGSDHIPITWSTTLYQGQEPHTSNKFIIDEDKFEAWESELRKYL